jgi:uncharacterized protein DUF6958
MVRTEGAATTALNQKVSVENVNHPGKSKRVDAELYAEMRRALLALLAMDAPGLTLKEIGERRPSHLRLSLFKGGAGPGWWLKTVQLDLEAKGTIVRERCRPIQLYKGTGED